MYLSVTAISSSSKLAKIPQRKPLKAWLEDDRLVFASSVTKAEEQGRFFLAG